MDVLLRQLINTRELKVGVVGLGYVGLPLIFAFSEQGFPTLGLDIDLAKVDSLLAGRSYIKHIPDATIQRLCASGRFDATTDFARAAEADVLLLCVPTPLTPQREPDMTYVVSTTESIAPYLRKGHLIVLESTTYPGTTRDLMLPILERGGLKEGVDFLLAYSPEREDPGNASFSTTKIPKVVGGCSVAACDVACHLYGQVAPKVVSVSSPETAEAVKLTENIFRAVNIALVNELKVVYTKMGIDVWEVIEAAKTKPFGFMPFYPGPGLGGHCIPIDPFYLTWKAREFGCSTRFIELAGEVNVSMPQYVVGRLAEALNDVEKPLKRSRILILGVSYKKDVDDIRESPALELLEILAEKGALVEYHDPFIARLPKTRSHGGLAGLESVSLTPEIVAAYDAVLIVTDHSEVDYRMIVDHAQLVVDTRNATANIPGADGKVVKA